MITLGSLFDGIGGFPLAAIHNGIVPMWASEIESFPIKVTKIRIPEMLHVGDITKLVGAKLPVVDVICGGSPCQDLSVAGARAGLAGERSGLFMEQIRVTKEMRDSNAKRGKASHLIRPRFFVWENVPGVFSSAEGKDFKAVLEEITRITDINVSIPRPPGGVWKSAGCILGDKFSIAWRVLDAQYWGVAQRRKRIFLVADFGGHTAPKILFEQDRLLRNNQESNVERKRTATTIKSNTSDTGGNRIKTIVEDTYCIASNTINRKDKNGGNGAGFQKDISYTLTTSDVHAICKTNKSTEEKMDTEKMIYGQSSFANYKEGCSTLRAEGGDNGGGSENLAVTKNLVRRLTPLECERLQGFPEGWTDIPKATDSPRYRALGNSVAVPCVDFIMRGIAYFLRKSEKEKES